jgi:hypothetical protein
MSADAGSQSGMYGSSQMLVKRQKPDGTTRDGNEVSTLNNLGQNGALIQAVLKSTNRC